MLDIFSILGYFLPKYRQSNCVWALLTTSWKSWKVRVLQTIEIMPHLPGAPDFEHKAPVNNKHCKATSFYASNTNFSLWYCFRNELIVKKMGLLGFLWEISWAELQNSLCDVCLHISNPNVCMCGTYYELGCYTGPVQMISMQYEPNRIK